MGSSSLTAMAPTPALIARPRIGIVGAGNIASLNVAGYLEDPRCDVVAVCDPKEGRAAEAARAWGVDRSYTDLADLLADPRSTP